jgi:hypothetical protein
MVKVKRLEVNIPTKVINSKKNLNLKRTGYYIINASNLLEVTLINKRFLTKKAARLLVKRALGGDFKNYLIFKAKDAKKFMFLHEKVKLRFYSKYEIPDHKLLSKQDRKSLRTLMRRRLFGRVYAIPYSHRCDKCRTGYEWLPQFAKLAEFLINGKQRRLCNKCYEKLKPPTLHS